MSLKYYISILRFPYLKLEWLIHNYIHIEEFHLLVFLKMYV